VTLYGNGFRATVTATNSSADNSYSGWLNCSIRKWTCDDEGTWSWKSVGSTRQSLVVDKSSSTVSTISLDGLEKGGIYSARLTYLHNDVVTDAVHLGLNESSVGELVMGEGYLLGYADGTSDVRQTSSSIDAGSAAYVDLTPISDLSSVTLTPSSNPNCLYLLADGASTPSGLTSEHNVVCGTTAERVTLTDGYDFYSPISFTATAISYNRTFSVAAAGTSGWNTILLPFEVAQVTCGGNTVDWFHSGDDTGKNFWLRAFTGDGEGKVYFDFADEMEANVPYLIAVPGDTWGDEWQMTGKTVTFSASNVTVSATADYFVSGNYYKFTGATFASALTDVYALNAKGSRFVKQSSTSESAFRAWIIPSTISSLSLSTLSIASPQATGIDAIRTDLFVEEQQGMAGHEGKDGSDFMYDLSGNRISLPSGGSATSVLPKGVYIKAGKKYWIK